MASIPPGIDIYTTPAGMPPPGVELNFENPENRAYQYYIVASIATALVAIAVFLRFYIQFFVTRHPSWDDAALFLGLLAQMGYTAVILKSCEIALGRHTWDITLAQELEFIKWAEPSAILTAPAILFTKLALLLLYLRIFKPNKGIRIAIWAGIIIDTVFYVIAFFLYIFASEDVQIKATDAVAVIGVVSDVYILILPMIAVMQLQLSTSKKVRVIAVFLTGLLAVIMGFVGCVYRFTFNLTDNTWVLLPIYIVNTIEVDIGIICACLPLLPTLFKDGKGGSNWLLSFKSLRSRFLSSRRSEAEDFSRIHSYSKPGSENMTRGDSQVELTSVDGKSHSSHHVPQNRILQTTTISQEVV